MMSSSNNNNNNGIFINKISENQPELQQPSIKRQRIDANNEQHPSKATPTQVVAKSLSFLDDSGNSTSSSSSSPSPVNESEIILKPEENDPIEKDEEQLLMSDKECLSMFQTQLTHNQCLCGLSERTLKIPFRYYSIVKPKKQTYNRNEKDEIDLKKSSDVQVHYVKSLEHWPEDFLLKFLSNLQLLFHIYLKQNAKGNICGKIMELCDCLIRNQIHIFEELIQLCNSSISSNFVSYISSKIITYFLIIIKDEIDRKWIDTIVDNLFTSDHVDNLAVKKVNFSLDIIKCIVEWKDHDEHILEEDANGFTNLPPPPLETNYFATLHRDQSGPSTSSSSSSALPSYLTSHVANNSGRSSATSGHNSPVSNGCHFVQLTDSESFDTAHIKCITTKTLANKWPALVRSISELIMQLSVEIPPNPTQQQNQHNNHRTIARRMNFENKENCILTFISLWESIISVRTNLSVVETLPFTTHLVNFELLLNQNLPCTIYKQMLQLFNEALCYGSTLALQDMMPEDTCELAHKIIRHVKDNRILETMPRQINSTNHSDDNLKTFIGLDCESVIFSPNSLTTQCLSTSLNDHPSVTFDKSLLQKMTLLVLKSVAVYVKEIRCDSSDSSIDSSDYDAFQDMIVIERTIREVLKKLESFMKNTLEFHPESHFSKILIHLFDDQDDFLIEAMVCTLDVTSGISFRNNAFPELVAMLNPVYTFLEFLKMISNSSDLLLDLLVSTETCFLLYLLRFLKYIRINWSMFVQSCRDCGMGGNVLDNTMTVMISLRYKIGRLVSKSLYPYDIAPILRLLESCENLYEGNELS
ncbi:CLUMA_CG001831, isoform A [Clunio marinus]|uniref:CLUMA_CG001831, isoform A n=1 Tax=Clunio marinus TaxID=568069 RepID=A0A1J1HJ52_9DIPT|nr:CLUMA_CG001831, isoform A [Clunio marinus]